MSWLGQIDCSVSLRRASKKRSPDTGLWLFEEPLFRSWIQGSENAQNSRMLWLYGAPGVGKTVLSATVIVYIQQQRRSVGPKDPMVAYYYGDSTDRYNSAAFSICISLLSQLVERLPDIPSVILERYRNAKCHGRLRISEGDEVFDLFREVVTALPPTFLIIDGLDECSGISDIMSWLQDALRSIPLLHLMCSSRDTPAVRKHLGQQPSIRMNACLTKQDIDKYLLSAVSTLQFEQTDLKKHIFETLSRKAEGMFLFADLSVQTLRSAINIDDALSILATVPTKINEMYGLILKRLSMESYVRQSLARRVFRLLCASARPITWPELRYALSWDAGLQVFRKSREPFKDTIAQLCCPLVEYQIETDTFLLAHFSFYEYLCGCPTPCLSAQDTATFVVQESQAQHELAQITLACLMDYSVLESASLDTDLYPLVSYAIKYWCHHLSQSPFDQQLYARYLAFMACPQRRSTWILQWLLLEDCSFPLQQVVKLHKSIQKWAAKGGAERRSMREILGDIQAALFRLDAIQSTSQTGGATVGTRTISNFERLVCVRDLAREYTMAGELDTGIAMFELARQKAESPDRSIPLQSCWLLNSLGILYDQQGKTDLAEEVQRRALGIQEKLLPPRHLDIVLTINELGRIARHLEQYQESEALHRKALIVLEQMFSEEDLHITWTKSALGRSLLKQGRPEKAMVLHQQVLAIETSRLGRDHPHTLWTLSDIARCHCAQNRIEDAIIAQQEVVERSRETLGADNPDTLWVMNSLGILHELLGHSGTARTLHTRALEGQMRILGTDHAHTKWSKLRLNNMREEGVCQGAIPRTSLR